MDDKRPILTVMFKQVGDILTASGVSEDVDLFRNVGFASLDEALRYITKRLKPQYQVICNVPSNVRR